MGVTPVLQPDPEEGFTMRVHPLRSTLSSTLAIISIFSVTTVGSRAHAEGAPLTKGPDAITVGAGHYSGPTPAELAKLATAQHEVVTVPPAEKGSAVSTIGQAQSHELTPAQLAKLQTLLQALPAPVPDMVKLPPMELPKDGIPELTAQEREKLAQLQAHEGSIDAPASENGGEIAPIGQSNGNGAGNGPAPAADAKESGKAVPTTPQKVSGSDR
jgi:hypothetical protein